MKRPLGIHSRLHHLAAAAVVAVSVGAPRLAAACSVCMSGREGASLTAFQLTTVFMSVLPLAMVGGLIVYLRRRVRALERGEVAERTARPVPDATGSWASPVRGA